MVAHIILEKSVHIVISGNLGALQTYLEVMTTLAVHQIIGTDRPERLVDLVNMRNIFVHEYQEMNRELLHVSISSVIANGPDFVPPSS